MTLDSPLAPKISPRATNGESKVMKRSSHVLALLSLTNEFLLRDRFEFVCKEKCLDIRSLLLLGLIPSPQPLGHTDKRFLLA